MWPGSSTDWEWGVTGCQVETECRQSKLSMAEREQALRLKSRAVELLPDGAANLAKLQVGLVLGLGGEGQSWKGPACVTCYLPTTTSSSWWRVVPSGSSTWQVSGKNTGSRSLLSIATSESSRIAER